MGLGDRNTLVVVQRRPDDKGLGIKLDYKPTGTKAWVSIEQLSGAELIVAQQIEARANLKLKTHWTGEILVKDRLVDQSSGRTFNIVAINNIKNMNRELELTCVEVVK
jgi:SPP1 family predicted phage head-tail adaptor